MKIKNRILLLICMFCIEDLLVHAQKHDNIWLSGYFFSGKRNKIDFSYSPPKVDSISYGFRATYTTYSISDAEGNLLFFSNGFVLYDRSLQPMQNGNDLQDNNSIQQGYESHPSRQNMIILPDPADSMRYVVFHLFWEVIPTRYPYFFTNELRATTVDMRLNNGLGAVVEKNRRVIEYDHMQQGGLTAVRHGNGRDWWLLMPALYTNLMFRVLLDPEGSRLDGIQQVDSLLKTGLMQNVFSPDGTKYARYYTINPDLGQFVEIWDFDRCSGLVSNMKRYNFFPNGLTGGIAFGPGSRYLYVANFMQIYQFDTYATDIGETRLLIGEFDGFGSEVAPGVFIGTPFNSMQLGPNGHIYIYPPNGVDYLHHIEFPDSAGLACGLRQHSLKLHTPTGSEPPNFPNYRLGKWENSACDTIQPKSSSKDLVSQRWEFKLFPNPVSSDITFLSLAEPLPETGALQVFDSFGQLISYDVVLENQKTVPIRVSGFINGLYFFQVRIRGETLVGGKFMVRN